MKSYPRAIGGSIHERSVGKYGKNHERSVGETINNTIKKKQLPFSLFCGQLYRKLKKAEFATLTLKIFWPLRGANRKKKNLPNIPATTKLV